MQIQDIINEIADIEKTLVNSHLADLSLMAPTDVKNFKLAWKTIELKRRRETIARLVELAADSDELNFDAIYKACLVDSDDEVRNAAIDGLWENEDPSLMVSLIDLLNNDPSEKVQASVALALSRFVLMAELGSLSPKYGNVLGHVLLTIAGDNNKSIEVRRRALEAVAPLSTEQVKIAIKDAYESHNEQMTIGAVYAMGRNCDSKWLPFLLKEIKSSDAEMRYEAVSACGELGDEDIVQYLLPVANDPDIDVRLALIQSLGKIGGNEAKQFLKKNAGDPNEAIREAIEQALNEISIQDDMTILEISPQPETHED